MKSIVIYNSKRGSTEQYARWIAEDIKAEQCIALEHADFHALDQFDVVVFGGWIRGSGIVGLDKLNLKFFRVWLFLEWAFPGLLRRTTCRLWI